MKIHFLEPEFAVADAVYPDDMAQVKEQGFRTVICNRRESEDDYGGEKVYAQAAKHLGLEWISIPVASGDYSEADVEMFRQVLWTGENTQLVLMAIPPGGEIGGEVHEGHDQLLYFVEGRGEATIAGTEVAVQSGDVSIVPSGSFHNFRNIGSRMLKLFTTYCPPEHAPGTEHETKGEADADQ